MRQPLTDSELKKLIMNKWSYSLSWSGDELEIANRFGDEILELITKDRQAHSLASRIDELERLIGSGAAGDKYRTKAKHGFVTIEERLEQLKEQSDV